MPPRSRKTAAKKEVPAVTEANDATVEIEEQDVAEETEPKRRGGRKRSELAHAAREFEKWDKVTTLLEQRYAAFAEKLSNVSADLGKARETRDAARQQLDDALNPSSATEDGESAE